MLHNQPQTTATVANDTYANALRVSNRFLSKEVPSEVRQRYELHRWSEPPAIPSDVVIAISRDTGHSVAELLRHHIGSLRFSYLEFVIASSEE